MLGLVIEVQNEVLNEIFEDLNAETIIPVFTEHILKYKMDAISFVLTALSLMQEEESEAVRWKKC